MDLDKYKLSEIETAEIASLLGPVGSDVSLEQLWWLMDQVWTNIGCNNQRPTAEQLEKFYSHPIWLLNGMFIENDPVSMGHRQAIASAVSTLNPQRVLDYGGGFGTLARLMAAAMPRTEILICEPYPPQHGIHSCKPFSNIGFISNLSEQSLDVLVSTDVLEHVQDPLALLAEMVNAVRVGGYLFIANCFFPVISCHLPCTFHLRYSFDSFCRTMGLEVLGPCDGSHATVYQRSHVVKPDWERLRAMEDHSQMMFPLRAWHDQYLKRYVFAAKRTLLRAGQLRAILINDRN